ncbi:msps cytoskeleton-associated protein 5 isoform X1 [Osmia lignaria lignaria]|uniref:msps cytoskeleton-associated protein 5 isoform X1 n=1 Tax=Osmia lignaria lignaria TaxID=1437193 RepID=UPI0014795584|nr:protein mini spindles isoform X1 [Osmia lignaria]XP_034182972.1 protein mini spindles isoform X1 [Osmia lignaria]
MEQDTEYIKLPLEERCVHKLWRARLHGYKECVNTFQCIDDEKSPEWNKFLGFIKKFVLDSNAVAQEKGLEAALAFLENAAVAGKTVGEVMNGIVTKCIAAPKTKTKDLAVQITLMYIEIEKHEAVQEELLKGTEAKNPKIVAACISTLTLALRQFGPKVINIKPLIKKIPGFLEDRDKIVRDEGKVMVVEIYRWIGTPLKQQLNTLKPVQLTELETEFNNLKQEKVVPIRFLKSQKPKVTNIVDSTSDNGEECQDDGDGGSIPELDPYELLEPVDILSKLPKDFHEKIEAKKWQERKEALEALEVLVKNPKLANGDYGDVVRALKKVISKDTNVLVVTLAGKCLAGLATGLKKRFQSYATACLSSILEKFREKKQTVVQALREAADAIFLSVSIDVILEDSVAALENKNPAVKAETAAYLARCFSRTPPPSLNKKLLKAYTTILLKTLNEPDPTVRDCSADALGTAMKLIGEKSMMPFLTDLDNLKMTKIKECAEKAVIHVKIPSTSKAAAERPNTAPSKIESAAKSKESEFKVPKRPNTSNAKKTSAKKPSSSSLTNLAGSKKASAPKLQVEKNYSAEEIDEMAMQLLPGDILSGLVDSNWKTRLTAVEQLMEFVKQTDPTEVPTQVIVRTLAKKPGFKDTNFQVLKLRLEIVKYLAENFPFSTTVCEYCIMDITEKLGDAKNSAVAGETLLAIAEATSFEYVADEIVAFAFNQKNPKVQQETLSVLSRGLTEFGCVVNVKSLMENIKKAVAVTNPGVRTSAITLLGTLYLFMGRPLLTFFENEKPALRQQIEQECEKHNGETPPVPFRGVKNKKDKANDDDDDVEVEKKSSSNSEIDINNLIPRIDISNQITESLLNELADKNWKVRNEGLQKINTIISDAKFIKGSIGDLPQSLALRLVDSNSKIAQSTLGICQALAIAMGPPAKQHIRVLFPGFIQCLGDSKNWIRTAAISCINTWGDQCGYKEFFDGEMIGDVLKSGSPILRAEVWNWLAQKLPLIPVKQVPKEELLVCLPHLYSNLEDRNSDVRKYAQEAVLGFMIHLSYELMARNTEKLKPGSRTVVLTALDKSRPNLPIKPLPKKPPPEESNQKVVKSAGAMKASKAVVKPKQNQAASKPGSARKKDDDVDTSPLLAINNLKHQRVIDEQKLKVLKWNFTTPREEFVELLKELMTAANVNKTLLANMFHSDFRYHLKAIEALTEDLPDNSKALVSNLDLILKWLTLRFFDTNPSVLLKGLEYLRMVFNLLIEDQYHMLENEAASFIPYLIIKIGDPKDAVRNGVRALFKQIALVYPVSKLFSYVMEGLKSKNARQRTECLDQLGSLIENYGLSVCQPSASVALKEIAKQIADRDNSVRNAALNCIVQAYFLQGERVYKLIGQISEKDQSLLDERIKRAAKNRPTKSASASRLSAPSNATPVPSNEDIKAESEEENEEILEPQPTPPSQPQINELPHNDPPVNVTTEKPSDEEQVSPDSNKQPSEIVAEINVSPADHEDDTKTNSPTSTQPKVSGPFGLDMDLLQRIELNAPVKYRNPVLLEVNLNDLNESPNALNPSKVPVIPISPPKLLVSKSATMSQQHITTTNASKEDSLERKILAMASLDLAVAIQSMNSIDNLIKSHQILSLQSKEDKFIGSINMQLKLLQTYPLQQGGADISKGFRNTFMVLLAFYDTGILGKNVPLIHLKELVDQMISLLAENKLDHLHQAEAYYRVINSIVCKIIDNSNHTTIICVLIKLLHGCAESTAPSKYEELVMKCLWKIVKTIPNWAADLDYDTILLEVHRFLKDYPSVWWKKRKSDTPLRTIKTILHSMTRVKGSTILSHLTRINNTNESELHSYLIRLIATFKPDEINSNPKTSIKLSNTGKSQEHLSKFTHQQLSAIFKKIGSKEHTQEGLMQLYDFKLQYPEADVQPFLLKSHQFFQDFIEQGLRDIDQARKNQNLISQTNNQYSTETAESAASEEKSLMDPLNRVEKLRVSEAQCRTTTSQPSPT